MDATSNLNILKGFHQFIKSRGEIVFSVVSEPPSSRPDDSCIDLCAVPWSPSGWKDGVISLDLTSEDGKHVGKFEFEWIGCDFVDSQCE